MLEPRLRADAKQYEQRLDPTGPITQRAGENGGGGAIDRARGHTERLFVRPTLLLSRVFRLRTLSGRRKPKRRHRHYCSLLARVLSSEENSL